MNILILAWRDIKHPLAGGAEKVMHEHAQAWALAGHRVTIFTSNFLGAKEMEDIKGVKILRRGNEILIVHLLAFLWFSFGKHPKFDLVIDQFHGIPFFTPLYVRTKKLAVIQEVAKEVWLLNHLPKPFNLIVGVIGYALEPLIFRFYKNTPFMTGSESAKQDLIDFGIPEKSIRTVHHGIRIPFMKRKISREKIKTVMYLGALTKDKGIADAIEVFSRLNQREKDIQFWVVGKGGGSYLKLIESRVEDLGLKKKIRFWGYVSERKKFELLSRAHVLINPSVREGWGLTVIESSFVGTPVVGYNVAGLKDSIRPGVNGYLVEYKDLEKMADRATSLLNDKKLHNRLSKLARNYARKFTWKLSNKKSLELIEKIARSLNILILNWKDIKHPEAGGAEQATLEHAKAWAASGHNVIWFASNFTGAKKEDVISGVTILRRGGQVLGVQLAVFIWYIFNRHPQFDIVVDQFHGIPFFTPFFVRAKKLAYIHEVAKEVWGLNPWPEPLNYIPALLGTVFEPFIFKIFYKKIPFLTVSSSTKEDLVAWDVPKKNITVIHNGVTLMLHNKLAKKEKTKTAVYLGALSRDKGIEDAIRAFSLINKIDPNWQLWIVGRGDNRFIEQLRKLSDSLRVSGKIKFWGFVSDKKKFDLLSRAHVLVNPSVREGWGLVNIEANAVGTPVVAYRVPGVKDSVKDGRTGLLSERGNPRSLASNVIKLVEDESFYKNLQKNAIFWSKQFTWQKSTNQSLNLIENL